MRRPWLAATRPATDPSLISGARKSACVLVIWSVGEIDVWKNKQGLSHALLYGGLLRAPPRPGKSEPG
jgi:hypothetical protein